VIALKAFSQRSMLPKQPVASAIPEQYYNFVEKSNVSVPSEAI